MKYETLKYSQEGPIGILTMNRPERLNAINFAMRDELRSFFMARFDDLDTRVLVVTGEGRGFCSGLDMKESTITTPEGGYGPKRAYELQQSFSDVIVFMRRCPQPVIGAINGAAVGGGFSIALACDIRLASPEARFSAAYINIGVGGADMGSSWLFPRAVGTANAARYLLTGDIFDAGEALRMGMVQAVVEKENLMEEAMKFARKMVGKSPLGLRLTKEAIDRNTGGMSLEDAVKLEDRNQAMCIAQITAQFLGSKGK